MTRRSDVIRLIWHRRDLRLHDNALYSLETNNTNTNSSTNTTTSIKIISLYIFDTQYFLPRPSTCCPTIWNTVHIGPHAARILIEAVSNLRDNIRAKGGELLIRYGDPLKILPSLAKEIGATNVCWSDEPGVYETRISHKMQLQLKDQLKITIGCGYMLHHPDDLPRHKHHWAQLAHPNQSSSKKKNNKINTSQHHKPESAGMDLHHNTATCHSIVDLSPNRFQGAPPVMGDFRRACRMHLPIRHSLPPPITLQTPRLPPHVELGDIPAFHELTHPLLESKRPILGMNQETIRAIIESAQQRGESKDPLIPRGGEVHALQRLDEFVNLGYAATAKRSLADVSGNDSSKLSIHLAMGTISPRTIVEAAKAKGNECDWLVSHLEMRDFFLYSAIIADHRLFQVEGMPLQKRCPGNSNWKSPLSNPDTIHHWERWAMGDTGLPLVDAAMRELRTTGYCSNRVRQNAASVLTKDLGLDWRAGAEWYQFLLEDHCVGANWGNWMYFAGVGSDPKQRHFRTVSQAKRYDPTGSYVSQWIPELAPLVSATMKHQPWNVLEDWGPTIVDVKTQYTWQDLLEAEAIMVGEEYAKQQQLGEEHQSFNT